MDSKERTIRSLRGFLLNALDIIETGKDYEILATNLPPFFWRKVGKIIRKNQQGALQEFLFGSQFHPDLREYLKEKSQILQNQLYFLTEKVRNLETRVENLEFLLRKQNSPSIQKKDGNKSNFIILGKLTEEEQIEIIQLGFQRNQEGKLALKEYFEGEGKDTLFESKGYKIKYQSIRKNNLYKKLKLN